MVMNFRFKKYLSCTIKLVMNILMITGIFPPDAGGPASYVPAIAQALKERGHFVTVITLSDRMNHSDDGYAFPVIRILRGRSRYLRVSETIFKIIRLGRSADLLFVHGLAFEAVLANTVTGKPLVQKIVGDLAWERARTFGGISDDLETFQNKTYGKKIEIVKALRKFWVKKSNRVITPSRYLKSIVSGWGIDPGKTTVIYNAVAPPPAGRNPETGAAGRAGSLRKIVSVGRLVPWKGFDGLIRVLAELPNTRLTIIGDGPEKGRLEKLIAEKGLKDRVFLPGRLSREQVFSHLVTADLFVLNSSYEGLPHIVLEAMAAAVPVIATNVGGTGELVIDGENGLLVRPGDDAGLKKAVCRVLENGVLQEELVRNGKKTLLKFSWEDLVKKTEAVLAEVISESRGYGA